MKRKARNSVKVALLRVATILVLFTLGQMVIGLLFSLPLAPIKSPDSWQYLAVATDFPSSVPGSYWGYVGYIGFLRLGISMGSATWFAITFNALAVIGASSALHALGRRFGGEIAGWVAVCAYLLNPMVAQWTRYVLTESLFYAGIILTAYCCVRAIDSRRLVWAPLWVVVTLTSSLRPNGILLLGAVATVIALARLARRRQRFLITTAIWALVLVFAATSPSMKATHGPGNGFGPQAWAGTVVHGVTELAIAMPEPRNQDPSNIAFLRYTLEHPIDVGRLGATRVWWEMKQVRPWYSEQLNAFLTVTMTGFYLLVIIGAWASRGTLLNLLVTSISIPFALVIASTWAIWEGRFGWWFLVLWTVWAGIGAQEVGIRIWNRLSPTDQSRQLRSVE